METLLSEDQLQQLAKALHLGASQASRSMAGWLSVPSLVEIDSVDQMPINDAADILGEPDQTLCFCTMAITGSLTGQMILAFDDSSGLSLADLLLNQPPGTADHWGDIERSAALETANIIGCAYLNALAGHLGDARAENLELLPSAPSFRREFVESLLQAAFFDQAVASDVVFVARTLFQIGGESLDWNMLFVPDAESMTRLRDLMRHAG